MALLFVVYIPTRDYERRLEEKKLANSVSSNSLTLSQVSSKKDFSRIANGLGQQQVALPNGLPTRGSPAQDNNGEPDKCMELELKVGLQLLRIEGAVWQKTESGKFYQVVFPCESQERCEDILEELTVNGIGRLKESSVSVVPCSVYCQDEDLDGNGYDDASEVTNRDNKKSEFIKSVRARLTVAQVVEGVRGGALITFDFIALLILAGLIAGFGLMDNSSVSIVASMLVSPLMGPIMAISFGAVIHDRSLLKLGILSELLGLLLCLCIGFVLGLLVSWWQIAWQKGYWPTDEMKARGQVRALWVGMLVALPSGAGVAMSIVGGNISCLVGVAISASLLPPSVNCGILWGNALILLLQSIGESVITQQYEIAGTLVNLTGKTSLLPHEDYQWVYSSNMARESASLGSISFCLTLVNIASIILMACVVFKIKEVAPSMSLPRTSRFWREDIKTVRDYNRTFQGADSRDLGQALVAEWKKLNNSNTISELAEMVEEAENDDVYRTIQQAAEHQFTLPFRASQHGERRGSRVTWLPGDVNEKKPTVFETFHGVGPFRGSSRRGSAVRIHRKDSGHHHKMAPIDDYSNEGNQMNRFHVTRSDDDISKRPLSRVSENGVLPV